MAAELVGEELQLTGQQLRDYYGSLYPSDLIARWLGYSSDSVGSLANREFAFILRDDVHLRYLSFTSAQELGEKLRAKTPHKVDIGAIYNRPPVDRKKMGDFVPVERELVFDIDLTDYDDIRHCCSGANVCTECWRWIIIAVRVLERLLRDHFGFTHLLWVFSGRRGVHCWVADKAARRLPNRGREAITKYLIFDKKSSAINSHRVHPMAEHAYRTIMESSEFNRLVIAQGWLDEEDRWDGVLAHCEDERLRESLRREFKELTSAELRWKSLKLRFDEVERQRYLKTAGPKAKLPPIPVEHPARNFLRYFVLAYAYPRLDEKVSTGINHLLKSPFSVHPKTGNIAVPFSARRVNRFQLDQVPTIRKLLNELKRINALSVTATQTTPTRNTSTAINSEKNNKEEMLVMEVDAGEGGNHQPPAKNAPPMEQKLYYAESSLAPYVEHFRAFTDELLADEEDHRGEDDAKEN